MEKKKLVYAILIAAVLAIGGWLILGGLLKESKIPEFMKSCTKNSDCTLVYGSCQCEAINFNYQNNPEVSAALLELDEGMMCFINGCQADGIFSGCVAGRCIKVKSN